MQLDFFKTIDDQKDEARKIQNLKQLAISNQNDIDLCCLLLTQMGYNLRQRMIFVFSAQLDTITNDDWVKKSIVDGGIIVLDFAAEGHRFFVTDGWCPVTDSFLLEVKIDGDGKYHKLWRYCKYLGKDRERDRPTPISRSEQVVKFGELLKQRI